MEIILILLAGGTMLVLAVAAGQSLGWADKVFHVTVDPRIEAVFGALPGANCGGCGCVGCMSYAEAVAGGKIGPDKCTVGGASCAAAVAKIMGVDLKPSWPYRPVVHCRAGGRRSGQRSRVRMARSDVSRTMSVPIGPRQ